MKDTMKRAQSSKGYTLLFAVIVSVLVLSIAAFILSVSRKQFILSSSARDSIYAFYAADSGLECAVENLTALATTTNAPAPISCGGQSITFSHIDNAGIAGTSTFSMRTGTGTFTGASSDPTTQSGAASCASTSVAYVVTPANGLVATSTTIVVEARGYNIGWKQSTSDCSVTGPRKVERALRYTQF